MLEASWFACIKKNNWAYYLWRASKRLSSFEHLDEGEVIIFWWLKLRLKPSEIRTFPRRQRLTELGAYRTVRRVLKTATIFQSNCKKTLFYSLNLLVFIIIKNQAVKKKSWKRFGGLEIWWCRRDQRSTASMIRAELLMLQENEIFFSFHGSHGHLLSVPLQCNCSIVWPHCVLFYFHAVLG